MYQGFFAVVDSPSTANSGILRYSRFFRLVKLLRLTKLQLILDQLMQRLEIICVLAIRCAANIAYLTLHVHISATVFYIIGNAEHDEWVTHHDGNFQQRPLDYVGHFMWAVTQMQGSTQVMPGNLRNAVSYHCITCVP